MQSRRAILIGALLLAFAWPSATDAADPSATLNLVIPPEKANAGEADAAFSADTLEEMTREAAERLRKRIRAAEIKHWDVVTPGRNLIRVSVYSPYSRDRLASILVPDGAMSIRPVLAVGDEWTDRAEKIPEGVELRQPDESMQAEDAFLWSRSRRSLSSAVEAIPLPGVTVHVYPFEGGWRTVAMGAPVATHSSVRSASIERGNGGDVYVRLHLDAAGAAEQSNRSSGAGSAWAIVLDGEVVRVWREAGTTLDTAISLRPPRHLGSKELGFVWAQQVAGRLAAHIPVPLVEVDELD
jgi:hypothetical protein